MGCFDTVLVDCPKCRTTNELQTKAGGCDLLNYRLAQVPPRIAGDLADETIVCSKCYASIRFDVQFLVRPYVSIEDEDNEE